MAYLRLASIPIEHMVAEMAAFPLASEAALRLGTTALHPLVATKQGRSTARLWRAAENALVTRFPSVSLDEVLAIRDRLWFYREEAAEIDSVPLASYARKVASRRLQAHGAKAVPRLQLDSEPVRTMSAGQPAAREAWRWMSFALPADFLFAALPGDSMPVELNTLSPQMERRLNGAGFVESHMHLGAGLDFGLLWVSVMNGLADYSLGKDSYQSPGAELNEGRDLFAWLLRAGIGRYLLAAFLIRHDQRHPRAVNLRKYLYEDVIQQTIDRFGSFAGVVLKHALNHLASGRLESSPVNLAEYQEFYRRFAGVDIRQLSAPCRTTVDVAYQADPLARFWGIQDRRQPTAEMQLVSAGLQYLEGSGCRDTLFAKLFWQITRVRNLLYRHIVQRPMTPGLPWFVRTYGRINPARRPLAQHILVESAALSCGFGRGLQGLEVRTSPSTNVGQMLTFVAQADDDIRWLTVPAKNRLWARNLGRLLCDANEQQFRELRRLEQTGQISSPPEFGIVFHVTRQRMGGAREGTPNAFWSATHADPTPYDKNVRAMTNPTGYRYASYYQTVRRETLALGRMLLNFPMSLSIVRGIDMCTDELAIPTWVIAPLFRYLRSVSHKVSHWLYQNQGLEIPPLQTTVHAGEDFVHLTGGLRRIDEAVRRLELREGDRLGHAIALGVDAAKWASSSGRIAMPREERLLDLVWEWICYARRQVPTDVGRRAFAESEILRLSQLVFGRAVSPNEMGDLVELLYSERALALIGFPEGASAHERQHSPADSALGRLRDHLCNPLAYRRGRMIEWVDPSNESAAIESLQRHLRVMIGKLGLAVEVNPSSNLLIANLGDLSGHPLWRLDPPRHDDTPPVPICIGSDDPLTFATNLRNEYMLVHDTLIMAGCSEPEARAWLERARQTGVAMRFTLPRQEYSNIKRHYGPVNDQDITLPP